MVDCFAQAVADAQREFVVAKIKVICAKRFRERPEHRRALVGEVGLEPTKA